jgi:hypothetical protein
MSADPLDIDTLPILPDEDEVEERQAFAHPPSPPPLSPPQRLSQPDIQDLSVYLPTLPPSDCASIEITLGNGLRRFVCRKDRGPQEQENDAVTTTSATYSYVSVAILSFSEKKLIAVLFHITIKQYQFAELRLIISVGVENSEPMHPNSLRSFHKQYICVCRDVLVRCCPFHFQSLWPKRT